MPDPDRASSVLALLAGFRPRATRFLRQVLRVAQDKLRTGSFVSAKGPKTIGARAWPFGCLRPGPDCLGCGTRFASFGFAPLRSGQALRQAQDSPRPQRSCGTGAQPRPQAPRRGGIRCRGYECKKMKGEDAGFPIKNVGNDKRGVGELGMIGKEAKPSVPSGSRLC